MYVAVNVDFCKEICIVNYCKWFKIEQRYIEIAIPHESAVLLY